MSEAGEATRPVLFAGIRERKGISPARRLTLLTGSILVHAVALLAFARVRSEPEEAPPHAVPVRIVQPALRAAPPPPKGRPAPPDPARPAVKRPSSKLVAPKEIPDVMPGPGPPEPPASDPEPVEDPGPVTGVVGGRPDGVVGGVVGAPVAAPAAPLPARPADLAAVRAGIARTLLYPPEARRRHWEGRTTLAFTLLADGTVVDLAVRQSSGYELLDLAALESIRHAAPFDPPGVDVFVVVPVAFRLR